MTSQHPVAGMVEADQGEPARDHGRHREGQQGQHRDADDPAQRPAPAPGPAASRSLIGPGSIRARGWPGRRPGPRRSARGPGRSPGPAAGRRPASGADLAVPVRRARRASLISSIRPSLPSRSEPGPIRPSISPSVYSSTDQLPSSGTGAPAQCSTRPSPSGGQVGVVSSRTPPRVTSSGGRWPAMRTQRGAAVGRHRHHAHGGEHGVILPLVLEQLAEGGRISSAGRPASTSARHATRRQTPSAASAGPRPQTSPMSACTQPSGRLHHVVEIPAEQRAADRRPGTATTRSAASRPAAATAAGRAPAGRSPGPGPAPPGVPAGLPRPGAAPSRTGSPGAACARLPRP